MKFRKIFHLEFTYQLRQVSTWGYCAVVFVLAYLFLTANYASDAREGYVLLNAPIVIAAVTVLCCVFWLLMSGAVAGDAAARDVQTRMFSLTYTSPASKRDYLGGRFLAALLLNVLVLLAIPASIFLTIYCTGIEPEILGPFRLSAYLSSYFFLVLPNAFIATAIQFSLAALTRKAMASYLGGVLLFVAAYGVGQGLGVIKGPVDWGTLVDPMGFTPVLSHLSLEWSPLEMNTRLLKLEGAFLANRILWLGLAMGMLALTYFRFQFILPETGQKRKKAFQPTTTEAALSWLTWQKAESLPKGRGNFGFKTHLHQLKLITLNSFWALAKGKSGLLLLGFIALVIGLAMPGNLKNKGVPMLPRTDQVLTILAAPFTGPGKFWMVIFLLVIFYAGELVWRERESGLHQLSNAAPVPEWVLFLSKYLAVGLLLVVCLVFLLFSGILAQTGIGGAEVEVGLYLKVLFGFQLVECLLFALLALVVHVVVNQKYLGHLVMLLIFGCLMFASNLGLEHKLLIFGESPKWTNTTMGGFANSVAPWLWFKAYWLAWALLLAVVARLLWVRSREQSLKARLQLARHRFTRSTAVTTAVAVGGILLLGGYIFYNTNMRHDYVNSSSLAAQRAAYELRYKQFQNVPQPLLTGVNLQVEMYPSRRKVEITGTYLLVNKSQVPIDSVHLAPGAGVETNVLHFDRPARQVLLDEKPGFRMYALAKPLPPGDSLHLRFQVNYKVQGFTNSGADAEVTENQIYFRNLEWLPVIGYQPYRELDEAAARKANGLAPRPATASLYDVTARRYAPFPEQISFEAIVGTEANQQVVAPGTLRRTWTKGGRRYFHYATESPIRNEYAFFSAIYAMQEGKWQSPLTGKGQEASIQIFYPPGRTENPARMVKSAIASLDYYTKEFGPYPHRQLRFVAHAGYGFGNHAAPINITAEEGFFLMNPEADERGFDLVTAVVAHEVAHQWWGNQLKQAYVEGAGLITESLAWYSAMGMLEEKYGPAHQKKLISFLTEEYENPKTKAALPLLQADNWYQNYRKGPMALYALSQYIGKDRVNGALRSLLQKHPPGKVPFATSLDLYQELEAATPDSLQYLLHDLFKANTFWDLKANQATVKQTKEGAWEVTINVQANKTLVNEKGLEKALPVKDWVEIGIFGPAKAGEELGKPLYLQKHLIRSKKQTITVTVPRKPAQVGIDPNHLLIDWNLNDNVAEVKKSSL
ncbi:ABC transporter permease/M1 family aminopeptidase [Rufibacter quisquiliarum]|uniref:ABC-type transport system involved in multi-copper enzyme maturation permease subunit n=1 Tax=Rufibacter quisquiliarum TaxID=1549639 RepID=A0A839GMW5_9BACT|nr:M1 family aminopeptidase [Rufibacter quisquiliarum]MBA9076267.1 ABC-type transport system involved in multi-copper enzyme maturation permease subunit [Rufibacter quisquiliarum]